MMTKKQKTERLKKILKDNLKTNAHLIMMHEHLIGKDMVKFVMHRLLVLETFINIL